MDIHLKKSRGPLLDHLDELEALSLKGDPALDDVVKVFGSDGHFIFILFLIIPFLQPIPLWGLSTPFGIVIAIVAVLAYLRRPIWVPKKWAVKKLPAKTVSRIAEATERVFEKVSRLIHPRWPSLFGEPYRSLSAVLLAAHALILALPLPLPLSNAVPAWMIAFQAVAHLERDGLLILLSYIQTLLCIVYFFLIAKGITLGFEAFN